MRMSITPHKIKRQSGISIITAIFLVIVLALMGAGMVSLLTTSQQSISQEITSAKAYMAGRSCLQWGMYQSVYASANGSYNISFNNTNSWLYNSKCKNTISTVVSDGLTFYNIKAIASFGSASDPEYSQRTMRLQFQP